MALYATPEQVQDLTGLDDVAEAEIRQACEDLDIEAPLAGAPGGEDMLHFDPAALTVRKADRLMRATAEQVRYRRAMPPEVWVYVPRTSAGPDYERREPIPRVAPRALRFLRDTPSLLRGPARYNAVVARDSLWFATAADED